MGLLKSPSPNGFSSCFYQNHWPMVGESVNDVVLKILNEESMNSNLNSTFIALILKKRKLYFVSKFRPISLCNVLHKLLSKVITNKLKPLMKSVVSSNPSTFIPRRIITNSILFTHEMIHSLNNIKSGKEGKMAIKLDMSKAFDRVE